MAGLRWRVALARVPPPKLDLPPIERFRGVVLLPPEHETLFDALRLVEAYCAFSTNEYLIHLVPPEGADPTGWALLGGSIHDGMDLSRRRPGPDYTQWRGPMPDGAPPGTLLKESFRGLRVHAAPSLIQHSFSAESHYEEWFAAWYDEGQNLTYTISLQGWVARQFGAAGTLSESNAAYAARLAALADQLSPAGSDHEPLTSGSASSC